MPIYAMKCDKCGNETDIYRTISAYNDDLPVCCDETMRRKITAPHVLVDIQPYRSMITGEMITSRSQHRDHLKDHGMIEMGNEIPKTEKKDMPEVAGLREELYARISDAKAAAT